MAGLAESIKQLVEKLNKKPEPEAPGLLGQLTALGGGAGAVAGAFQQIVTKSQDLIKAIGRIGAPVPKGEKAPGALAQVGAALGGIAGVAGAVVGALQQVVSVTQGWVEALQPGLIQQFNGAFRDLQATLGVAFTGIFEQGIGFLQKLAAQIAPVMQQLKPVIDTLTKTVLGVLAAQVANLAPVFSHFAGVFQLVASLVQGLVSIFLPMIGLVGIALQVLLAPVRILTTGLNALLGPLYRITDAVGGGFQSALRAIATVLDVLVQTIGGAVSALFPFSDLEGVLKRVNDAFVQLRNWVLITAARMALLAGSTDFVRRLIASLSATGEKAAGPTTIKTLEQIGKDLAQASVNAAGSAGEPADATNKDIVAKLQEMIDANKQNADNLAERLVREGLGDRAASALKTVGEAATFFASPLGWAANKVRKNL